MKKNAKWIFIIWLVLCCVSFDFVLAEGESVVKKVLVYSDRAMVTRDQNIDVTAGRRSILFTNLPTTMDRRSVRVSGKGTASVKILDVQVKSQFFTQASRVDNRELEKEVLQLQRQKATLQDRQGVLQKSQEFLERLLDRTLDAIAKDKNPQTVSIDKYKQMSLLLEEKLSTISQENRKISWQIQELDVQTETLRKQININPVASQKESCNVIVEVEVKRAGNLLLSLSYLMPNASWSPAYDLYIANEQEKDAFVYSAYVKQQTGEDWLDSQLTLSTAQPMVVTTLPNLNPVYLDLMAVGNGMISGTCFLDDGSRIPGLNIEVSGASSKKRTTITNANGYYQIVGLPEGIYTVRASLEGLNSFNRSGISVRGGRNSIVDIYMRIASIAEEVVVAGGVPVIDRQITEQEIRPEPPAPLVEALTETTKPKQGAASPTPSRQPAAACSSRPTTAIAR